MHADLLASSLLDKLQVLEDTFRGEVHGLSTLPNRSKIVITSGLFGDPRGDFLRLRRRSSGLGCRKFTFKRFRILIPCLAQNYVVYSDEPLAEALFPVRTL